MKFTLFLVAFVAYLFVAVESRRSLALESEDYSFETYLREFGKNYQGAEYLLRKQIFQQQLNEVVKHNKESSKTWKKGINHMSDWTDSEFSQLLGVKKGLLAASKAKRMESKVNLPPIDINALPSHVDWREMKIVSPVKDQGRCGSCWTFATAETIESHWALTYGRLQELSEQQILDCTPNPQQCGGQGGCSGGTAELAFQRIMQMGGLSSEWTYPYRSYFGDNFTCSFDPTKTKPLANITSYKVLPSNKYEPVLQAVATQGPLIVSVDASSWRNYHSGVFDGCNQTNPDIDHAVQLVGYGTDINYGDYWLIRNSWTADWADEGGYIRIKRTPKVQCGIDLNPSDGTGCNGGPSQVVVCGTCGVLYDVSYPIIVNN
jgi:cathepsin L